MTATVTHLPVISPRPASDPLDTVIARFFGRYFATPAMAAAALRRHPALEWFAPAAALLDSPQARAELTALASPLP